MLARLCSPNRSLKMAFHWNQESEGAEKPSFCSFKCDPFKSFCLIRVESLWFPSAGPLYLETVKGPHPRVTMSTDVTRAPYMEKNVQRRRHEDMKHWRFSASVWTLWELMMTGAVRGKHFQVFVPDQGCFSHGASKRSKDESSRQLDGCS